MYTFGTGGLHGLKLSKINFMAVTELALSSCFVKLIANSIMAVMY